MATVIFDVTLDEAGRDRTCDPRYANALFILREGRRPVGKVTVPVRDGAIPGLAVARAIGPAIHALAAEVRAAASIAAPPPATVTATAAICTRERPEDLEKALAALMALDPPAPVIVIDNAPVTEATRRVVEGFPAARYVLEPRKGLDNARNRALREATTDVVAFIDDDAVADRHWLAALVVPFERADVAAVTGLTLPLELENDAQEDIEELAGFSRRGFRRREFRIPHSHPLHTGPVGAGANMAIRRAVIEEIGAFDPALDAGTPTQSGGDHEFFSRLLRAGHTIVYEPAALNRHRHRRTRKELIDTLRGYGTGAYAMFTSALINFRDLGALRHAAGWFLREQLPDLIRSFTTPGAGRPRAAILAELKGCAAGPGAYLRARAAARRAGAG